MFILTEILLECKGDSVGVLVSGPRKMRQEVAAICSSSLEANSDKESLMMKLICQADENFHDH